MRVAAGRVERMTTLKRPTGCQSVHTPAESSAAWHAAAVERCRARAEDAGHRLTGKAHTGQQSRQQAGVSRGAAACICRRDGFICRRDTCICGRNGCICQHLRQLAAPRVCWVSLLPCITEIHTPLVLGQSDIHALDWHNPIQNKGASLLAFPSALHDSVHGILPPGSLSLGVKRCFRRAQHHSRPDCLPSTLQFVTQGAAFLP